eukprot:CAMPEP_0113684418 /NCGR_PEP_ID=MMETSP0038_2-20120614/13992_1 /TAXON_ID=2898 /ORGANISM="Cryptomonas paramecium" /LENGTH=41 /DNA_ID=CAMNT_0000604165 /DNA_START=174 /DNA_END=296 /DNA_ORIENTATION=+ /assembly_acc=CAM_ASM_000170
MPTGLPMLCPDPDIRAMWRIRGCGWWKAGGGVDGAWWPEAG